MLTCLLAQRNSEIPLERKIVALNLVIMNASPPASGASATSSAGPYLRDFDLMISPNTVGAAGPSVGLEVWSRTWLRSGPLKTETVMSLIRALSLSATSASPLPMYDFGGHRSRA